MASPVQQAKTLVKNFYHSIDQSSPDQISKAMESYCDAGYTWNGMHPFNEIESALAVGEQFWKPLRHALTNLQRRQDIFIAGENHLLNDNSVWVVSMGHLMGLHDHPWLNIPATGKMAFMRYCEFHQICGGSIRHSTMFFDIPELMIQAGVNPFPPQSGAIVIQPGPMTHSGIIEEDQDPAVTQKTYDLINSMIGKVLEGWDDKGCKLSLEDELPLTWHQDMIWWGPTGIGATYTIDRYIKQHSSPFRKAFCNKKLNNSVCRMAEGLFGGIFGWPEITLTPVDSFMGMAASRTPCDMRIVDIYRRHGDKLAENWVFIDMLHFWYQQGLDVLGRLESLRDGH